jgi:hypothetical protein
VWFARLDKDGDSKISLAEFEAGMNRQKKAKESFPAHPRWQHFPTN